MNVYEGSRRWLIDPIWVRNTLAQFVPFSGNFSGWVQPRIGVGALGNKVANFGNGFGNKRTNAQQKVTKFVLEDNVELLSAFWGSCSHRLPKRNVSNGGLWLKYKSLYGDREFDIKIV